MTAGWQNDLHRRSSQLAAVGVLAFMVALFGTIGSGLTTRRLLMHGFATVYRPPYVPALDPIRAASLGIPPVAAASNPVPSADVRAIEVTPHAASLLIGGIAVRRVHLETPALPAIARAIHNDNWIANPSSGVYDVKVALVWVAGTRTTLAAPAVRRIELVAKKGVLLGFLDSKVLFDDVVVTSPNGTRSSPSAPHFRPFVEAAKASTVTIHDSTFENLGWDWNASYGLSLMGGSTATVTGSTFTRSFIGAYTDHSTGTFVDDAFSHDDLYGLDPHSYSTGLIIKDDVATHNAAHGIIFSNHVTRSVVSGNVTDYNGENGIMMDQSSIMNQIRGNRSWHNSGDGVVLSSSSANVIKSNSLQYDRIGINAYGASSGSPVVVNNAIAHNIAPAAGLELGSTNEVSHNVSSQSVPPPTWHVVFIYVFWPLALVLFLLAIGIRVGERRRLPMSLRRAPAIVPAHADGFGSHSTEVAGMPIPDEAAAGAPK
jgi:poly(beta-D-mannuronate) C5 epimerase